MAGLAAARALRAARPGLAITVYEKSRGLGGRAATRRRAEGFVFDHGAQYFKTPTAELERLITRDLPHDELFDIARPVWTFDHAGTIAEGDPLQNADPKWSYRSGISTLGKLLGDGLTIQREVRVAALRQGAGPRWSLVGDRQQPIGDADMVLLTPPAPQTADLLAASDLPDELRSQLVAALQPAVYRRCLSLAFGYARAIHRPFYALVNTDRAHPISWVALEHEKGPQRCPPGHALLIAQMGPAFSAERWDTPADALAPLVAGLVGDLLGEDLDEWLWADRQGWRFALPDGRAELARLGAEQGLFFAGDYTAGLGRVHTAIEAGWRAAAAIAALIPS
jgi:renalase